MSSCSASPLLCVSKSILEGHRLSLSSERRRFEMLERFNRLKLVDEDIAVYFAIPSQRVTEYGDRRHGETALCICTSGLS